MVDTAQPMGRSFLRFVRVGDLYAVKQFDSGTQGKVFRFATPKAPNEIEASTPAQSTSISVE